jgi:ADP-heptose:LPS heptosyltransferase
MNLALVQLDANGDCLYATTIARQIKQDYPGCHLSWWISSRCRGLLVGNPYVDEVVSVDLTDWSNPSRDLAWALAKTEILRRQAGPNPYDRVWMPQIHPDNFRHFDGTVRPSQFRGYDRPITVPIEPVIHLTKEEKANVARYAAEHRLTERERVVLFECSSNSSQSHVTPEFAKEVAALANQRGLKATFLLSTMVSLSADLPPNALSAGKLTMRENLALLDHCSHFIGCGSGLTVIATCDQAKNIPNIQILDRSKSVLASFFHDFRYWGKNTDRFIEMPDASPALAVECLQRGFEEGHDAAVGEFHRPCEVTFEFVRSISSHLISRGQYLDAAESLAHTFNRYPDRNEVQRFACRNVLPLCRLDKSFQLPCGRAQWDFVQRSIA